MPHLNVTKLNRRKQYTPRIDRRPSIESLTKPKPLQKPKLESNIRQPTTYEIFAYCSKNYRDAYNFVIPSWIQHESVDKVTIYTDWEFEPKHPKVEIIPMFEPSRDWVVGTGRRLNVIKHFSKVNRNETKNILFLDIDCYMTQDVKEIFNYKFDIAISRLKSKESYANKTATAGLWFARLTPGYFNFINDWFAKANEFKNLGIGIKKHLISYVQYSFTSVAKENTNRYKILPIDEKIYNSEHTDLKKWYEMIKKYNPKILHYKGRRFREQDIVEKSLSLIDK